MPGTCTHEFFWPLKAADGLYYQVCRFCGVRREYDWQAMQRVESGPAEVASAPAGPKPHLRLLTELEPAHRVFLDNLADVLRPKSPAANGLQNVPFWREVLFYSDIPWQRFAESMVGHLVVLAVVLLMSQVWSSQELPRRRSMFENSHLTYYKPTDSFPALRGNPAPVRPYKKRDSARKGSIRVTPERAQAESTAALKAPDLKLKGPARPNLAASNPVTPAMPLASTGLSRLTVPAGSTSIVAPPPEVSQGTARRLGLPQASGVAPAPEMGIVSSERAMNVPAASVVGPAPVVQAAIRKLGDLDIGPSAVIAPAPRLPLGEQSTLSGMARASSGSLIALAVPPPPSAPQSGNLASGRGGSMLGGGAEIVPPPPSVQAIQNSGGTTPGGLSGSWSGAGLQPVPPAPSLQSAGDSGGERGSSELSSAGVKGIPPAPSVGGGGASDYGNGGRQMAMNAAPAAPAAPLVEDKRKAAEKPPEAATEEMPLRLIGLAMALPNSSYFSNYEVYIAERRLRKNLTELVKLVYVYLPYQRRLSEYGVDNSKVYKLLVSRDHSCDESLMQMTWPETDPHPDAHNMADSPALTAADRNNMLPCYRTTADDYRKAISRR